MFADLAVEPVMNEAQLRTALKHYKQEFYGDPRIHMPGVDELDRCLQWMGGNANAQFMNCDIAKILFDGDANTRERLRWTFERMKASATMYVQLRHHQLALDEMTHGSLELFLKELPAFHMHLNLGGVFRAETNA